MPSEQARNAIAYSLDHAGISIDPGKIKWNSALEPTVLATGKVST
jgi:hypothetical protein